MCVCPKGTRLFNNTCIGNKYIYRIKYSIIVIIIIKEVYESKYVYLTDINECEEYGVCDQFCLNSYGKYICSCDPDYELINHHECKIKGNVSYKTLLNHIIVK